jgi:hypothetical protein
MRREIENFTAAFLVMAILCAFDDMCHRFGLGLTASHPNNEFFLGVLAGGSGVYCEAKFGLIKRLVKRWRKFFEIPDKVDEKSDKKQATSVP